MNEIKLTWKIAQQISKRHTFISLKIALPLYLGTLLLSIIVLKLLGYQNSGVVLKQFYLLHRQIIIGVMTFIYFIPINFYAIIRAFDADYPNFKLKVFGTDPLI